MASSYSLLCCLCRRPIGKRADVYALDGEWQRRYPEMVGSLACQRCALFKHTWKCYGAGGKYVDGHIGIANQPRSENRHSADLDSWDHIEEEGAHAAMILLHPRSGLLQGAKERVRATATSKRGDQELIAKAREALQEWHE